MKAPSLSGTQRPGSRSQSDRLPWSMRALLESTPFTIADYGPRATIYAQGDPCDSMMHIDGDDW